IRIEKKGYRLQEGDVRVPADGRKDPLRLILVPAHTGLGDKERQAIARDIVARVRDQITPQSKPGQVDLSRYLRDWANKLGYSFDDVKAQMERWASGVEANPAADPLNSALAAYMRKEFALAADLSE